MDVFSLMCGECAGYNRCETPAAREFLEVTVKVLDGRAACVTLDAEGIVRSLLMFSPIRVAGGRF
jgi:hypothetical protein